ncbi:phosphatidylserine decarboxylase [Catalinimonas alkaloidigena]|uniref:Phosphatidylserine decarboxylase proenzyme n=1 Tax=Catalinimonas alkaloidigena TaxID=1075417 RepID=A0A1G9D511_9BACT|nr:phosphatidylserine decarboxylase family protein [Catalinimonas alkaloidigena]SDK59018.1 phosphatidylserine decarboxylase [Catalinimonas alkaloidigena]
MKIHKEGYRLLLISLLILVLLNVGVFVFAPTLVTLQRIVLFVSITFFLLILQFFRSPRRTITTNERFVLAPADGKVVVIEQTQETEYLNEERIQISVFMSPVNVHSNINPVSGVVEYFKYHAGKYLVAWHPKSSLENERTTTVVRMTNDVRILFRQIAGALAKRIVWYVEEGMEVEQGAEFGFIKFGSRVDVFLPLNAEVKVKIGDRTKGGITVLAELPA